MTDRTRNLRPKNDGADVARSVCPYCAVGCGQLVYHKAGKLISIEGDPQSPISRGHLCPKGADTHELHTHKNRLKKVKYRAPYSRAWQEIDLAKTEMTHKATRVGKDIGFLVAGGAVAYAGLLTLIAFVVLWLGSVIPMWTSAFIVAIAVLAVGGVLVKQGISNLKKEELPPRQTLETLKDDKQWATEQTR